MVISYSNLTSAQRELLTTQFLSAFSRVRPARSRSSRETSISSASSFTLLKRTLLSTLSRIPEALHRSSFHRSFDCNRNCLKGQGKASGRRSYQHVLRRPMVTQGLRTRSEARPPLVLNREPLLKCPPHFQHLPLLSNSGERVQSFC